MKETKTVQVYPNDDIVNSTIDEYGSFGWEVIGNQRCQEYEGQTHGIDGSTVRTYSTFNKITFTREKTSDWYDKVSHIENEYFNLKSIRKSYKAKEPVLRKPSPQGGLAVGLGLFLYLMYIVPGVIYTIVRCSLKAQYKKRYQKQLAEYEAVYPEKIREIDSQMAELRANAENLVLGKA